MSGRSFRRTRGGDWLSNVIPSLLCVLLGAWLLGVPGEMSWSTDAHEYLRFARAILSGELFDLRGEQIEPALAIRTPGYPALLSGGMLIAASDESSVRLVHAAVAAATLLGVPILLLGAVSPWIAAPAVLLVQLQMRSFYPRPITEWVAANLLLWLFALMVRHGERPGPRRLVWVGLAASACVLVRPALVVVLPLPFAMAWIVPAEGRLRSMGLALLSLAPLLVWMGFNQVRLGAFTLTPFGGMNVFGVASLVGDAEVRDGDGPRVAAFIRYVNDHRVPVPSLREPLVRRTAAQLYQDCRRPYNTNIHELARPWAEEQGIGPVELDRFMWTYAVRSLRAQPRAYLRYILLGLGTLGRQALLLPPLVLLALYWLARRQHRGLALASLGLVAVHVAHLVLCAVIEFVIWRYRILTFAPLLGVAVIAGGTFVLSSGPWRRLRAPGPSPRR